MTEHPPQSNDPTPPPATPVDGPSQPLSDEEVNSKKILCGILAILLGYLGIHKFILGYTTPGIIMLLVSVVGGATSFLCIPALGPLAMGIIGIIEGIMYLTKSNTEFSETYLIGKKEWF